MRYGVMTDRPAKAATNRQLFKGTLDLLLLRMIAYQPSYGWELRKLIREASAGRLRLVEGSLYPGLHRLTEQGLIRPKWSLSATRRRTRMYHITDRGKRALAIQLESWERVSAAVNTILAARVPS